MAKKGRKYIYISNLNFDGTVFQTQVLDWLHLYDSYGLDFNLVQAFHVKDLIRPGFIVQQTSRIRKNTSLFKGYVYLFPSKGILYLVNTIIIFLKLLKPILEYKEILIFSRALIGREIRMLRKISPAKILFYFDGRAASAEENRYVSRISNSFTLDRFKTIATISYLEYFTLNSADKIFVVSNKLMDYFKITYNLKYKKFVYYPCLSDSERFYFSNEIRKEVRAQLRIEDNTLLIVYSGGVQSAWHLTAKMFTFINHLFKQENHFKILFLTKDLAVIEKMKDEFPGLTSLNILSFSVPNNEVIKYLNAADYGILFRENTVMNNVASPTKYAEYMLCGLPVLISEGVGDYSDYTIKKDTGFMIKETELDNPKTFNYNEFIAKKFDRNYIASIGMKEFSKASIITSLIAEFQSR